MIIMNKVFRAPNEKVDQIQQQMSDVDRVMETLAKYHRKCYKSKTHNINNSFGSLVYGHNQGKNQQIR